MKDNLKIWAQIINFIGVVLVYSADGTSQLRLKVSPKGFKSARTDDASFSNVRVLADASSCKAANKSTI